jgi:Flp pilus assembly CpaE family ATPase
MMILAYCPEPAERAGLAAALPAGAELCWCSSEQELDGSREWRQARVLLLVATAWPDAALERLLTAFLPRPVVLLDITEEGHWRLLHRHRHLYRADRQSLGSVMSWLLLPDPVSSGKGLAILTERNDYDGAMLTIAAAWALSGEGKKRVLVLDFALPHCDIAAYLDMEPRFCLSELARQRHLVDEAWLAPGPGKAGGLDLICLPSYGELAAISVPALHDTLERLARHYDHLVFNLTGQGRSSLVTLVAGHCSHLWLLADQKNISIKSAACLADYLLEQGARPAGLGLMLAPYYPGQVPDAAAVAARLPIPLLACLPDTHAAVTSINSGLLPDSEALSPLLQAMAGQLGRHSPPWWQRWMKRSAL